MSRFTFIAILLLAALFRFMALDTVPPGLWQDEALVLGQTVHLLQGGPFGWHLYEYEPLYAPFALVGVALQGASPQGLRFGSALAGLAGVAALYWFAASLRGRKTAVLAALLLAVLPWHVIFSRIGFRGITLPLSVALVAGCADQAMRWKQARYYPALGLALAAGFYSYVPFKVMFPVVGLYGLAVARATRAVSRRPVHPGFLAAGVALLLVGMAPGIRQLLLDKQWLHGRVHAEHNLSCDLLLTAEGPLLNSLKVAGMFIYQGDPLPRHNTPGDAQIPRVLFPFLVLGLWRWLARWKDPRAVLLLGMFVLCLLPSVFSKGAPHALRTLGAVVPVCVLTAEGLRGCQTWLRWRYRRRFRAAIQVFWKLSGLLLIVWCAYTYFIRYGRNEEVWNSFQAPYAVAARDILTLPAGSTVLHEPMTYGRVTFETLTQQRSRNLHTVRTAHELSAYRNTRPLYMLFLGRDQLGSTFLQMFPNAQHVKVYTAPSGQVTGFLFRAQ